MQQNLAQEAAGHLKSLEIPEGVQLDFGIKNSSQLLRAYSANGKELDPKAVKNLDDVSNAMFANHGKLSQEGTIYEADIHGKVLVDENGKIKADPQQLRDLVNDDTNGIAKFHQGLGLSDLTVKHHILPEEAEPARPAPAREQPAKPARAETPAPAEAPAAQRPGTGGATKI